MINVRWPLIAIICPSSLCTGSDFGSAKFCYKNDIECWGEAVPVAVFLFYVTHHHHRQHHHHPPEVYNLEIDVTNL